MAVHAPITYLLAPMRPKTIPTPPERVRRPSQPLNMPRTAKAAPAPMPLLPPPEAEREPQAITQTAPPPDPFAPPPPKAEDDLKQRSLKSAYAIDKQLRKESWTQRDRKVVNDETALATAIGKAYVGGGSGAMQEVTMADGTRMTKWRMPGGATVCFYKESNGFSGGRDPFRDTGRLKIMSCP